MADKAMVIQRINSELERSNANYSLFIHRTGLIGFYDSIYLEKENFEVDDRVQLIQDKQFKDDMTIKKLSLGQHLSVIGNEAFKACTCIKELDTSKVGYIEEIGYKAFSEDNFKELKLRYKIRVIQGYAFYRCRGLAGADIVGVKEIGEYGFCDCIALKKIDIGNNLVKIGEKAFYNCTSLRQLDIGVCIKEIGSYGIANCAIDEIVLAGYNMTVLNNCCDTCYNLKEAVINISGEKSVVYNDIFRNCIRLKRIIVEKLEGAVSKQVFNGIPSDTIIYCNEECIHKIGKLAGGRHIELLGEKGVLAGNE